MTLIREKTDGYLSDSLKERFHASLSNIILITLHNIYLTKITTFSEIITCT